MPSRAPFQKHRGFDVVRWRSLLLMLLLFASAVVSFSPHDSHLPSRSCRRRTHRGGLRSTTEPPEVSSDPVTDASEPVRKLWLDKGLLLSSFSDGLVSNWSATDWLMSSLVEALWKERRLSIEMALENSNMASPCNGPDPDLLGQLEATDRMMEGFQQMQEPIIGTQGSVYWKDRLGILCRTEQANTDLSAALELRVLYVPTAMYALRPGSTSKPGKQRQRNRSDAQKRRDGLLRFLSDQLNEFLASDRAASTADDRLGFAVRTVTMDLDDASVKKHDELRFGDQTETTDPDLWVPKSGKEAIRDWKPHLIYVQGGNTFWLHHCVEKGDWAKDLIDACCRDPEDDNSFPSFYVGVSAGTILAGESMQTACWKEWDDPSVVPGKETYGDWTDSTGLGATGRTSFFPHMTEEWRELTEGKTKELLDSTGSDGTQPPPSVICLRDDQAYAIDGRTQRIIELEHREKPESDELGLDNFE